MRERQDIPRGLEFALFGTSMLWAVAAAAIAGKAAHGIVARLRVEALEPMLGAIFLSFLAVLGFQVLDWVATRRGDLGQAAPLPWREGWGIEWGVGAALGWGLALAAVLPLLLSGNLHGHLQGLRGVGGAAIGLGTLLAVTLAEELIARGYGFQRLCAAVGPSWGAVLGSGLFASALVWPVPPRNLVVALLDGTLFGILLAMAYLRTRGLWVGWGAHFAYRAIMAVVLGLPIVGRSEFASFTDSYATGPLWLNGGGFGLDGAALTGVVMLAGMAVLYRATKEYAWRYTAPAIVAAGYEVTVAPPPAHAAMERETTAVAPPPLVQIMPVTPRGGVVRVAENLRAELPSDRD